MTTPAQPGTRSAVAALVIGAAAGFTLAGYEFVRSVSSSLFIEAYGAARLPLVMAAGPVGTLALLWVYGASLSRLGTRRVLTASTLASAVGLLLCFAGLRAGIPLFAAVLYVLREGYIVLLIEQYWSFIDSTLDERQAARWNGPVCGIASVGAIAGGLLVSSWAGPLGSESLVVIAAAALVPVALLCRAAYRVAGDPERPVIRAGAAAPESPSTRSDPDATGGADVAAVSTGAPVPRPSHGALALSVLREHPTVRRIAILVVLSQVVSTLLDLAFNTQAEVALPLRDARTAYFGSFYATLNTAAFLLQFGVAPLLLRWLPVRTVHLGIPALHVAAAVVLVLYPSLMAAAAAFLLFKAVDYSVFRASKEILYIHTPFDARYRTKEVIDAFGYRASKGLTAAAIAGLRLAGAPLAGAGFALGVIGAGAVWLAAAVRLPRGDGRRGA